MTGRTDDVQQQRVQNRVRGFVRSAQPSSASFLRAAISSPHLSSTLSNLRGREEIRFGRALRRMDTVPRDASWDVPRLWAKYHQAMKDPALVEPGWTTGRTLTRGADPLQRAVPLPHIPHPPLHLMPRLCFEFLRALFVCSFQAECVHARVFL